MAAQGQTGVPSTAVNRQHYRHEPAGIGWHLTLGVIVCVLLAGCATVETTSGGLTGAPRIAPPAGPRPRQISAAEWRAAVLQWLGTPYRYGGNDRRGVDCSGFTQQLYKSVAGINLPRTAQAQFGVGISVPRSALRAGDLVFFSESGRGVFHVGISLGGDEFAHASTTRGVTITSLRDPWYAKRWCGAKRVIW